MWYAAELQRAIERCTKSEVSDRGGNGTRTELLFVGVAEMQPPQLRRQHSAFQWLIVAA